MFQSIIALAAQIGGIDAIAFSGCIAAMLDPAVQKMGFAAQASNKNFLMVAHQKMAACVRRRIVYQALNDMAGVRPAINQISKKNDVGLFGSPPGNIVLYLREKVIQQIQPSVYITDCVRTLSGGGRWPMGVHRLIHSFR